MTNRWSAGVGGGHTSGSRSERGQMSGSLGEPNHCVASLVGSSKYELLELRNAEPINKI